jgi:DNA-binding transcriptional ArsR family regulator
LRLPISRAWNWKNGQVPRYATPPLPPLEPVVSLGFNRTKLAILIALADLGGQARTPDIAARVPLAKSTLLHHLKELADADYVTADQPISAGVRVAWTIHADRLNEDLTNLMRHWTPPGPHQP